MDLSIRIILQAEQDFERLIGAIETFPASSSNGLQGVHINIYINIYKYIHGS